MRAAMEVIAHEMIHTSQICHGRMRVQKWVLAPVCLIGKSILSCARPSRHQTNRSNGTNGLGKSRHVTGRRSWFMSFLSGPVARCRPSRFKSASLTNWPCIACQKHPTPAARVTPVSTVPVSASCQEPQKPHHILQKLGDNCCRALAHICCRLNIARLRLMACHFVTVSGRSVIEEKRHEVPPAWFDILMTRHSAVTHLQSRGFHLTERRVYQTAVTVNLSHFWGSGATYRRRTR